MWLGENQRKNTLKTHVWKRLDYVPHLKSTLINKHASLPTIITNSGEVQFLNRCLLMPHHTFANATLRFHFVNLIVRGWRTWKTNRTTPTYLKRQHFREGRMKFTYAQQQALTYLKHIANIDNKRVSARLNPNPFPILTSDFQTAHFILNEHGERTLILVPVHPKGQTRVWTCRVVIRSQ